MKRRDAIRQATLVSTLLGLYPFADLHSRATRSESPAVLKHSVSRWCYSFLTMEELCQVAVDIGLESIELTGPREWAIMKEYGLTCAMGWDTYPDGVTLDNFACNPDNHDRLFTYYQDLIPVAADNGVDNLIILSGQRQRRSRQENLDHAASLLVRVLPMAQDYNITISIEYLNSKVDHPDHQFDHMQWGVDLCDRLDSDYFKILYDIYHAQIMEGNVVATIRKYSDYISHYHTAGVPGRHHIDDTQELNYPFIVQAIRDTGYRGYIGHEFIPTGESVPDKVSQLRQAVEICSG